jgi:hypothetical protein
MTAVVNTYDGMQIAGNGHFRLPLETSKGQAKVPSVARGKKGDHFRGEKSLNSLSDPKKNRGEEPVLSFDLRLSNWFPIRRD